MHKLLARQLRRFFGSADAVPESLKPFVGAVEEAYEQSDLDRAMLEHSMETVSVEMADRLSRLRGALDERDELAHALSLLEATLESTADGILVTDLDGRLVRCNSKFQELWNVPAALLDAHDGNAIMEHILDQLDDPAAFPAHARERQPRPEIDRLHVVQCTDGRSLDWFSMPQRVGEAVVGRVWSFRDISARHTLEHQLRQVQKMDAVGQLAGGVAHDFNNLLTIIRVNAELLAAGKLCPEDRDESVDEIASAADRATDLTRQLLAFSRKQVLKARVFDLGDTISGLQPMLRRLIGEQIKVVVRRDAQPAPVFADPGQLEQVVVNLAINARDAMPQGGCLTIAAVCTAVAQTGTRAGGQAGVAASSQPPPPGDYVCLEVTDTGVGIAPEALSRIFEPFYTTKARGKGTGLGLSVAYGIVKQSAGHISVDSTVGSGTSVRVFLPRAVGALSGPDRRTSGEVAMASARGTETVLVAEDEESLLRLLVNLLRAEGYTVLTARSGVEALAVASSHRDRIDLLLTDVIMPELGGRELSERLRLARPDIRVLFMSGYTNSEIDRDGFLPEDAFYLQKPFSRDALTSTVRSTLDALTIDSPTP